MAQAKSLSEKAEELEFQQMKDLGDLMIYRSNINKLADGEYSDDEAFSLGPIKPSLMGEDPRLPAMPEKPTLVDFFKLRFGFGRLVRKSESIGSGEREFRFRIVRKEMRRNPHEPSLADFQWQMVSA